MVVYWTVCKDLLQVAMQELNTTKTLFPGTELRLIYDLVSSKNL